MRQRLKFRRRNQAPLYFEENSRRTRADVHMEAVQTPKGGEAVTFVGHVNLIAASLRQRQPLAGGWPLTNYYSSPIIVTYLNPAISISR